MLSSKNIIYFGPEKWEGMWRNRQHLMSRLSEYNKVIYVEPRFTLKKAYHQLKKKGLSRYNIWKEIKRKRVQKISNNLYVYKSPLFVPIFGRFPFGKITWMIWKAILKRTLRKNGVSKPIVWVSRPYMIKFKGFLNEILLVYHVVDEYSSYGELTKENIRKKKKQEINLLKVADVVIVVSEALFSSKQKYSNRIYHVPNGVDYEAYTRVFKSHEEPPDDIKLIPKPIIGYSGLISN